jgi:hypothetical protein
MIGIDYEDNMTEMNKLFLENSVGFRRYSRQYVQFLLGFEAIFITKE